jgi:paraquat-inducible protein A
MPTEENTNFYSYCKICSNKIHQNESFDENMTCERCGEKNERFKFISLDATLAFSLTALIFFVPTMLFPFMTIELYGNRNSSTVWGGVVSLVNDGSWPIGLIVFLASLVIPLLKLLVLFYLSFTARNQKSQKFKTRLYLFIEAIGRWSMLDIFLLAVLVALLKLGHWTSVKPELGSLFFAFVVIFTMLASAAFDPKFIWENKNENTTTES